MDYINFGELIKRVMPEGEFEVPEWGGLLRYRILTSADVTRAKRRSTRSGKMNDTEFAALIITFACPDIEPAQYMALTNLEAGVVSRVSEYILYQSGYKELAPAGIEEEQGEA